MIFLKNIIRIVTASLILITPFPAKSQSLSIIHFSDQAGLKTDSMTLSDNTNLVSKREKPVLSFLLDEKVYKTGDVPAEKVADSYLLTFENKVRLTIKKAGSA